MVVEARRLTADRASASMINVRAGTRNEEHVKIYVGRTYSYDGRVGQYLRPGDQVIARGPTHVWRRVLVWPVDVAQPTHVAGIVCRMNDLTEVGG